MEDIVLAKTPDVPVGREIGIITAEVKELCRMANKTALAYAIEIGRRLREAKTVLAHGEWGNWLEKEVEFSQSTANNFMKLFEEYGSQQISLFGAVSNSQTIANLPYSKALKLLAVPSEEREEFAEKVDAENISVKELEKAIKERDEAIANAEAERAEREKAEELAETLKCEKKEAESKVGDYKQVKLEIENLKSKLKDAEDGKKEAEKKLKEEKEKPVSDAEKKKIEDEAKAEAGKRITEKQKEIEEIKKELASATEKAKEKEKEAELAEQKAKAAEYSLEEFKQNAVKERKETDGMIAEFKVIFGQVQTSVGKLKELHGRIAEKDKPTADRLAMALTALNGTFKLQ